MLQNATFPGSVPIEWFHCQKYCGLHRVENVRWNREKSNSFNSTVWSRFYQNVSLLTFLLLIAARCVPVSSDFKTFHKPSNSTRSTVYIWALILSCLIPASARLQGTGERFVQEDWPKGKEEKTEIKMKIKNQTFCFKTLRCLIFNLASHHLQLTINETWLKTKQTKQQQQQQNTVLCHSWPEGDCDRSGLVAQTRWARNFCVNTKEPVRATRSS